MIMPSFTTLPESMLDSSGIAAKFGSQPLAGLRGLGCGCSDIDDSGNCLDPDPCTSTGSGTFDNSTSDCAYGGVYPACNPAPTFSASDCAYGGVYPNCNPAPGGTTYSSSPSQTLTPAQQLALDQSIVKSGSQLATILAAAGTGATILPNGTIVGGAATGSSLATLGTSLSSFMPILLIGFLGIVALKAAK